MKNILFYLFLCLFTDTFGQQKKSTINPVFKINKQVIYPEKQIINMKLDDTLKIFIQNSSNNKYCISKVIIKYYTIEIESRLKGDQPQREYNNNRDTIPYKVFSFKCNFSKNPQVIILVKEFYNSKISKIAIQLADIQKNIPNNRDNQIKSNKSYDFNFPVYNYYKNNSHRRKKNMVVVDNFI